MIARHLDRMQLLDRLLACLPTYLSAIVRQHVHVFWRSGFEGIGGIFWFESFQIQAKLAYPAYIKCC